MLRPLALAIALSLTACAQEPAQPATTPSSDAPVAGRAIAILNAGVMTEHFRSDGAAAKFLFDPLYDNHFGSLEELPPELIETIVSGGAPYDSVDAVFVSHAHGDHFSASMLTRMLAEQDDVIIVAPRQAIERMRQDEEWDDAYETRVRGVALLNGEAGEAFEIAGATIEAFRTPHNGWPDRHSEVHNITFRVSLPAGQGQFGRVMHLGDADPAAEHYAALRSFLQAKRTGLAMVPYWFYGAEGIDRLVNETLNAQNMVAMHVPAQVPENLASGNRPYFSEVGEISDIPVTD